MALTRISNDTLQDATITQTKLGTEFTTSAPVGTVVVPNSNLFPGVQFYITAYEGTSGDSSISIGTFEPTWSPAENELAGATFTFTGADIGSIPAGSYIVGSNTYPPVSDGFFYSIKIILNPTEQTNTAGGGGTGGLCTFTGDANLPGIDFSSAQVFTKTLTANENIAFTNYTTGAVKDLIITGSFPLGFTTGTVNIAAGNYNGDLSNLIQVICVDAATPTFWVTISQPQV